MFLVFFVLFPFFKLSSAFTLSLPDRFDSRTLVTVQWTRDSGDAFSFGLMQRSLQGNQSVLSVTPVENSNAGSSGTTQVAFNTAGQVLLSVISQLSLSSGEIPEQLSAGKQLTVVPSDNGAVEIPGTTGVSPFSLTQMSTTSPATAQASPAEFAQRPGMQRSAVIALAVILPLLFLSAVAFCIVRYQRRATRERIDRFNSTWTWTRAQRATISSFGNDIESVMIPGHGSVTFYP